jgi:hypothetical protein
VSLFYTAPGLCTLRNYKGCPNPVVYAILCHMGILRRILRQSMQKYASVYQSFLPPHPLRFHLEVMNCNEVTASPTFPSTPAILHVSGGISLYLHRLD